MSEAFLPSRFWRPTPRGMSPVGLRRTEVFRDRRGPDFEPLRRDARQPRDRLRVGAKMRDAIQALFRRRPAAAGSRARVLREAFADLPDGALERQPLAFDRVRRFVRR